jgi:hypothetical protein
MSGERVTRAQLRGKAQRRVRAEIVNEMLAFLQPRHLHLWGEQQPGSYLLDSIYLTLYHDLFNIGYNEIFERVQRWYPNSMHSLHHNTQALRLELKDWARGVIELGELDDWIEDAADTLPDQAPNDVNIWVDSVDYQIQGRRSYGKKSDKWSFKRNAPGRRYMIFRNGLGKVIKIFGGYSPKIRDYMWIEERADWINESLEGATLIGDNDWRVGMAHLDPELVTVHAPHSEPRGRRRDDADMAVLTDAQRRYNAQVQRKRARIENYFATSRSKFEALQQAWAEDEDQLDALVWYAAAVVNRMKDLRNQ